jgi:uncharacterized damage-inducible protein DinB
METCRVLIDAFTRISEEVHSTVADLTDTQLLFRPSDKGNSIAWLIWHLTRVQDDHISELADREQVWIECSWHDKFKLPFSDFATGFGHTSEEVSAVQASAEQLLGYFDAVHAKTIEFLNNLKSDDYERIVDTSWDPPVTMAVRLVSVLADDLQHVGQAAYIRGLL